MAGNDVEFGEVTAEVSGAAPQRAPEESTEPQPTHADGEVRRARQLSREQRLQRRLEAF